MSKKIKKTETNEVAIPVETPVVEESNLNEATTSEDAKVSKEIFEETSEEIQAMVQELEKANLGMSEFVARPEKMKILLEMEAKRERITKAFGGGGLGTNTAPVVHIPRLDQVDPDEASSLSPAQEQTETASMPDLPLDIETTPPYNVGG